jgi:hypothetical protein
MIEGNGEISLAGEKIILISKKWNSNEALGQD